jgi:hypothetical protein
VLPKAVTKADHQTLVGSVPSEKGLPGLKKSQVEHTTSDDPCIVDSELDVKPIRKGLRPYNLHKDRSEQERRKDSAVADPPPMEPSHEVASANSIRSTGQDAGTCGSGTGSDAKGLSGDTKSEHRRIHRARSS